MFKSLLNEFKSCEPLDGPPEFRQEPGHLVHRDVPHLPSHLPLGGHVDHKMTQCQHGEIEQKTF